VRRGLRAGEGAGDRQVRRVAASGVKLGNAMKEINLSILKLKARNDQSIRAGRRHDGSEGVLLIIFAHYIALPVFVLQLLPCTAAEISPLMT
jgi:hypothetical protein